MRSELRKLFETIKLYTNICKNWNLIFFYLAWHFRIMKINFLSKSSVDLNSNGGKKLTYFDLFNKGN